MSDHLQRLNAVTEVIIAAAIKVHKALGPGLLESVYLVCLVHELRKAGLQIKTEQRLPVVYDGLRLDGGFRVDLMVNDRIVVEVKSIKELTPIDDAQLLTYLKLTGCPAGLLLNFNVPLLKLGIKRRLNPSPTVAME